jgi:hypothetical protein
VKTIALPGVEGRIDHLAWDSNNEQLVVAALGNHTVEIIAPLDSKPVRRIGGLKEPQGVLAGDNLDWIVVASAGDGTCRMFDPKSLKPLKVFEYGSDADNLRYDSKAKHIYVGYGNGALGIIDAAGESKIGDIKLAGHPESFQLESEGKRIFVNVPDAGHIAVVDREKKSVIAKWAPSAKSNFPMALDEAHRRLYVGCRKPPRLLVFDTRTGEETDQVECSGDVDDLFYDAIHNRVYMSCGEGFLDVFRQADGGAWKRIEKIPTAAGARTSLFVPGVGTLYVAVPHRGSQQAEIRIFKTRP